jgi:hypothetical protein
VINSYASFVQYFRELAQQSTQLAGSFYVGDSWRIISAQRSEITYPALWLEYPIITDELDADGDTLRKEISFAFSITGGQPTDDWAAQDARLDQCREILGKVIARLKKDSDANLFDLILPMQAEPLATVMADDQYGWRTEGRMTVRSWTECYHAEDWTGIPTEAGDVPGGTLLVPDDGNIITVRGKLLDKLIIIADGITDAFVNVGTTPGGTDIIDGIFIPATGWHIYTEDLFHPTESFEVYFTTDAPITVKYRLTTFS